MRMRRLDAPTRRRVMAALAAGAALRPAGALAQDRPPCEPEVSRVGPWQVRAEAASYFDDILRDSRLDQVVAQGFGTTVTVALNERDERPRVHVDFAGDLRTELLTAGTASEGMAMVLAIDGRIVASRSLNDYLDSLRRQSRDPALTAPPDVARRIHEALRRGETEVAAGLYDSDSREQLLGRIDPASFAVAWAQRAVNEERYIERARQGACAMPQKHVCTAMNAAYGLGTFRSRIWLQHAASHLTPAHQRGYHRLFLPLIRFAYGGEGVVRRALRRALEHIARERTADIWAERRGARRRPRGRAYRAILEPLCRLAGRVG